MPRFVFNPFTGKFDSDSGITRVDADARYVNVTGDSMTGDLTFPEDGFVMTIGTASWRVTIDNTGALVTTLISAGSSVQPGPLLGINLVAPT